MNLENRLPSYIRDRARDAGGAKEWSDRLWDNLSPEKRAAVDAAVRSAPAFSDLIAAVRYAALREKKEPFIFVITPWDAVAPEYRVISAEDCQKHGANISFIHQRIVVASGMARDALEALTTDTIEEV